MSLSRRAAPAVLAALLLSACTGGGDDSPSPLPPTGSGGSTFAADTASSDLYVGPPQRFQIGVFSQSQEEGVSLLSGGEVSLRFSFLGAGGGEPSPGPEVTASFLPAPTMPDPSGEPTLRPPDEVRGVYQANGVTFDQPGPWQVDLETQTTDGDDLHLSDVFEVSAEPALPAPGDEALKTKNLTIHSKGVPPEAIDSRATSMRTVPDADLHEATIADGIAAGRPVLALFSTPVYCASQMCGPSTDGLEQIAKTHPGVADYVHVEIYRKYDPTNPVINQAAADWLLRNGDLTEPWLFLIGPDGTVLDRWSPLFDSAEVERELEAVLPSD